MSGFDPHLLGALSMLMGAAVAMVLLARKKGIRGFRVERRRCPACGRYIPPGEACPCSDP